jgi:hypothetical protein
LHLTELEIEAKGPLQVGQKRFEDETFTIQEGALRFGPLAADKGRREVAERYLQAGGVLHVVLDEVIVVELGLFELRICDDAIAIAYGSVGDKGIASLHPDIDGGVVVAEYVPGGGIHAGERENSRLGKAGKEAGGFSGDEIRNLLKDDWPEIRTADGRVDKFEKGKEPLGSAKCNLRIIGHAGPFTTEIKGSRIKILTSVFTHNKRVETLRYMHRNPVTRGLMEKPENWPLVNLLHYKHNEPNPVQITLV